jgi:outer membrane protein TolC
MDEAAQEEAGASARMRDVSGAVELQTRRAKAGLAEASERIAVAEASVAQAEESLRIVKIRYEAGLATVSELLRNESALLEARTERVTAIYDQRMAAVLVELAQGTLTGDSDVLE